ncbi:hypothetical protein C2845_PM03G01800 [Panicum miliaceum]|uniref:Uncharacterized protein n=1 Tax=Panicum miliaceum TaxID=4540 RepID=A0A3L6TFN4_PANMI|nr:hypothetical protein C2845_PM03G01800 [Panicum miliaceum]
MVADAIESRDLLPWLMDKISPIDMKIRIDPDRIRCRDSTDMYSFLSFKSWASTCYAAADSAPDEFANGHGSASAKVSYKITLEQIGEIKQA